MKYILYVPYLLDSGLEEADHACIGNRAEVASRSFTVSLSLVGFDAAAYSQPPDAAFVHPLPEPQFGTSTVSLLSSEYGAYTTATAGFCAWPMRPPPDRALPVWQTSPSASCRSLSKYKLTSKRQTSRD